MLIGDPHVLAIECHHEPLPNETRRVFGRMCLWIGGASLGNIDEPACMLDVTAGVLERVFSMSPQALEPELELLDPRAVFDLLDQKLYGEDARSDEEVRRDVQRFARFEFLTNGGESFDRSKSFLVRRTSGEALIVFVDDRTGFHAGTVDWVVFEERVRVFLRWLECQRPYG